MKQSRDSPEFVEVFFDEGGHPIDVRPAKNPPGSTEEPAPRQNHLSIHPSAAPTLVVNQELIEKLLIFVSKNIESLRTEIKQSNFSFQNEFVQAINKRLENIGLYLNDFAQRLSQLKTDPTIGNKLEEINLRISDFENQLKSKTMVEEKLEDMSLRFSSLTNEIAETKAHEIQTTQNMKLVLEEILLLTQELQSQRVVDSEFLERFNSIEQKLKSVSDSVVQTHLQTQDMLSKIEERFNEFSNISNELDSLKNSVNNSISNEIDSLRTGVNAAISEEVNSLKEYVNSSVNELTENQIQMKTDLIINQEQFTRQAVNDAVLKIKKMLAKKKKRIVKPQRAKVVKFLKKNFNIKPFSKVLVVTDKRNSVFGKTMYEAARKVSKRSVLAMVEDKAPLGKPVKEAIKQSNYSFIIGNYSIKSLRKMAKTSRKFKMVSVKRTLKFSAF